MGQKREERDEKMKLVDTSVFIDFFRGFKDAKEFFMKNAPEIIFSSITEAELLSGSYCAEKSQEGKVLHFLSQFEKIAVDNPLVQTAGKYRREAGVLLPDALIAASAVHHDAVLVTSNVRDFQKIKKLTVEKPY